MTATTLSVQPTMLAGLARSGGDAQERAATNPVAALPCAPTPLLQPLVYPLPLAYPPISNRGGGLTRRPALFGLVEATDPGQSRAKTARDWPGSVGKLQLWRATGSRWVAGAFVSGRPPTNPVGGLPPGNRRHPRHSGWSHG